jgi:hypothetical protein
VGLAELHRSREAKDASENAKSAEPGSANAGPTVVCSRAPPRNEPRSRLPGGLGIQIQGLAHFLRESNGCKRLQVPTGVDRE